MVTKHETTTAYTEAIIIPARVGSIEVRPIRPIRETVARDAAAKPL